MTRSDLIVEVTRLQQKFQETTKGEMLSIVVDMHKSIERVYTIVFTLEKDKVFGELGSVIRKALE